MLLVKTKIGPSRINGIGLFADQFIPQGLLTWKLTHGLDLKYPPQDLERLHEIARLTFLKHAYLSTRTGLYVLCSDDARFFNHSYEPNIGDTDCKDSDEGADLALRDIVPGEELTCDYRAFDTRYLSGFS
ncbi:MAG: SET domain-containing protein-lysine N-methyltransferase [Myxococcaceae bacterium]